MSFQQVLVVPFEQQIFSNVLVTFEQLIFSNVLSLRVADRIDLTFIDWQFIFIIKPFNDKACVYKQYLLVVDKLGNIELVVLQLSISLNVNNSF